MAGGMWVWVHMVECMWDPPHNHTPSPLCTALATSSSSSRQRALAVLMARGRQTPLVALGPGKPQDCTYLGHQLHHMGLIPEPYATAESPM